MCASVPLPVAVKLSPYYSAMASFAARVVAAGARRAGPVQSLLPARPGPGNHGRGAQGRAVPDLGAAPALALDRHLATPAGTGPFLAATSGVHTGTDVVKVAGRRRRRGHDDLSHPRVGPRPTSGRSSPSCARGWPNTTTPRWPSCVARCPRRPRSTPRVRARPTISRPCTPGRPSTFTRSRDLIETSGSRCIARTSPPTTGTTATSLTTGDDVSPASRTAGPVHAIRGAT